MGKIAKLSSVKGGTVQYTVRVPLELARRLVSLGKSEKVEKSAVMLHFLEWGATEYELTYGKPDQVGDEELFEPRKKRRK